MNYFKKFINREIDGRWFLTGSHILLVIVSVLFYNLQRSFLQISFGYVIGIATEYICFKLSKKYQGKPFIDRAFSAAAETAGLLVLLKSHIWWFYGLLSLVAVLSKYIFRKNEKEHIFNPTNFAIVFGLSLLPTTWFAAWADEFMVSIYPMFHVGILGMIAVWLGRTYLVSISYVIGFAFWLIVFYPLGNINEIVYAFGPEVGTIGLIFLFLMITDPKTAPKNYYHQCIYGFSISFFHIYIRTQELLYSRYIALFIVTLSYYLLVIGKPFFQRKYFDKKILSKSEI